MNVDSAYGQTIIAKWSLIFGGVVSGTTFLLGYHWIAYGTIFGLLLMLLNWRVLSKILRIGFNVKCSYLIKGIAFAAYYIRFFLVVVLMFLVIPKTNLYFGVGMFFGFLIPESVIGYVLLGKDTEQSWSKESPAQRPPEK